MPVPGLKAQVAAAIPAVFGMWEGSGLRFMYTDSKGLVTTGTGNLIDPVGVACAIPDWVRADGSPATQGDIVMAWGAVKGAWPKVQSTRCAGLTTLRLTPAGVTRLLMRTVAIDWAFLRRPFPRCNTWPADAQLCILSLAWAWGPGFTRVWGDRGQSFIELCSPPEQFSFAAQVMLDASAHEESRNPGLIPRDRGQSLMLQNANAVNAAGADPEKLWYPGTYA